MFSSMKSPTTSLLISQRDPSRIQPMESAANVSWALGDMTRAKDPKYIKAVIESYVRLKLAKGKSVQEVGRKLDPLEREFPKLSEYFIDARETYNLGISRAITLRRASEASSLERPLSHLTGTGIAHITPYRSSTSTSLWTSTSEVSVEITATPSRTVSGREREGTSSGRQAGAAAPRQLGWHEPSGDGSRNDVPEYSNEAVPPPYTSEDPLTAAEWMRSTWIITERDTATAASAGTSTGGFTRSRSSPSTTAAIPPQRSPRPLPLTPPRSPSTSLSGQTPTSRLSEDAETAEAWEELQLEQALQESLALHVDREEQAEVARAVHLSLEESRAREGWSAVVAAREGSRAGEGQEGQQQGTGVGAAGGLGGVKVLNKNPFLRQEAGRPGGGSRQT